MSTPRRVAVAQRGAKIAHGSYRLVRKSCPQLVVERVFEDERVLALHHPTASSAARRRDPEGCVAPLLLLRLLTAISVSMLTAVQARNDPGR
jgi:hypothetical protein